MLAEVSKYKSKQSYSISIKQTDVRVVLKGKAGKEVTELFILEYLEKISENNFALAMQKNNSVSLNRGDIVDLFLLRTPLANRQKSKEPNFLRMIDSFTLSA